MKIKVLGLVLIVMFILGMVGCTKYYQITDPTSGNVYYTKKFDRQKSGAVEFSDEKNGSWVTVQNSEVQRIKKNQYKKGISQPDTPAAN